MALFRILLASCRNCPASPITAGKSAVMSTAISAPRSFWLLRSWSMVSNTICAKSTGVCGGSYFSASMRLSDIRSRTNACMRSVSFAMIPKNRPRVAGSSPAAGSSNVSMNPLIAASGVNSSWLALATKSTRIFSAACVPLRSAKWTIFCPAPIVWIRISHNWFFWPMPVSFMGWPL